MPMIPLLPDIRSLPERRQAIPAFLKPQGQMCEFMLTALLMGTLVDIRMVLSYLPTEIQNPIGAAAAAALLLAIQYDARERVRRTRENSAQNVMVRLNPLFLTIATTGLLSIFIMALDIPAAPQKWSVTLLGLCSLWVALYAYGLVLPPRPRRQARQRNQKTVPV